MAKLPLWVQRQFVAWKLAVVCSIVMVMCVASLGVRVYAATSQYKVMGTITDSTGKAVTPSTVTATDAITQYQYSPVTTDSAGQYVIYLPASTYNIQVNPPSNSGLAPAVALNRIVSGDTTLNFVLSPATSYVWVYGKIVSSAGVGVSATVWFAGSNGVGGVTQSNSDGTFSTQVVPGDWAIHISGSVPGGSWDYSSYPCTTPFSTTTLLADMVIPYTNVTVHAQRTDGSAVSGVAIFANSSNLTPITLGACSSSQGGSDYSGSEGNTNLSGDTMFQAPLGTYSFNANPASGSGLVGARVDNVSITAATTTPVVITLPAAVIVTGRIVDSAGSGISAAVWFAGATGTGGLTQSDSLGYFSAEIAPGNWGIHISGSVNNGNWAYSSWDYDSYPCVTSFSQSMALNDIVIPVASVTALTQAQGGTPISGVSMYAASSALTPITLGACSSSQGSSDFTGSSSNTGLNGDVTVTAPLGVYSFTANPSSSSGFVSATVNNVAIISGVNTPLTFTLTPTITVNGRIVNSGGSGVSATIWFAGPSGVGGVTQSDGNGNYSTQVVPGDWAIHISGNTPQGGAWDYSSYPCTTHFSASTSLTDITVPYVNVKVHVQTSNGTPLQGVGLSASSTALTPITLGACSSAQGGSDFNGASPPTGSNGDTMLQLPQGVYSLSTSLPSSYGFFTSTLANLTIASDVTEIVALEPIPPTVAQVSVPTSPVQVSSPIAASASFTDVSPTSTHTAIWNWGDGAMSAGVIQESNGSGTVAGSHTYTGAGVYVPSVTITSDRGGVVTAQASYIAVYDPAAGFVTGSGWIISPAGAYATNPSLTGKAVFGFVAKYQKGATTPTGQTQFDFRLANLSFQSTSYQWLVISGAKAQYKGSGTINGGGSFAFLLTATDGEVSGGGGVDKFRIKIWDTATGTVVYDNQMGGSDTADPTTALGSGDIIIHS